MKSNSVIRAVRSCFLRAAGPCLVAAALGAGAPDARALSYNLTVPGTVPWYDTGIDILSASQVTIAATGMVQYGPIVEQITDANGGNYDGTLFFPSAIYPTTVVVSLIGKIGGTTDIGTGTALPEGTPGKGPGFVGVSYNQSVFTTGRLFLGFNDLAFNYGDNSGSFNVSIAVDPVPEPSSAALLALGLLSAGGIQKLRRRGT